jgi:hypothetical protein
VVGQSIERVKDVFIKQVEKVQIQKIQAQQIQTQVQVPPNREYEDAMPSFVNNDDEYRYESSATPRENNAIKVLMGRMISLLLNYPLLADENGIVFALFLLA